MMFTTKFKTLFNRMFGPKAGKVLTDNRTGTTAEAIKAPASPLPKPRQDEPPKASRYQGGTD